MPEQRFLPILRTSVPERGDAAGADSTMKHWVPALLRASTEVVAILGGDGVLIPSDGRLWELLGLAEGSEPGPLRFERFFPDVTIRTAEPGRSDFVPVQLRRADGMRSWVLLKSVPLPPPRDGQHLLLIQEPSAVRRIVDRLDFVEDFDPATGLFSRNRGHQQLKQLIASGTPGCCVLITLNAPPSAPLTRTALEVLLQTVVAACQQEPGLEPTVARNAEAELLLLSLSPQLLATPEAVQAFKARIAAAVAREQPGVPVTTGVSNWDSDAPSATAVLDAVRLDQGNGDGAKRASHAESTHQELLRAMAAGEMVFHIEPQVRASDGEPSGGELLLRWHHPQRGTISPGAFIEQLEHPSCSSTFINWSIDTALQTLTALRERLGEWFPLSLNLSGSAFREDLPSLLSERASRAGVPPAMLELEITERLIAEQAEEASTCLRDLRAAGFRIAVDDFGTGYSSLAYIRDFPLDRLKVDRSFVMGIAESEEDRLITTAIISLSHVLDLSVVVEGVESSEQAQILRELGAETLQGYLFSHPLPLDAFVDLLQEHRQHRADADLQSLGDLQQQREEPVVWKRSFSTDLVSVDEQHRHLIDLLNQLTSTLREAPDTLDIALALQNLGRETSQHFSHEEQVMANISYDRLELHRQKHQALLAEFSERSTALVEQARLGEIEDLIAYLKFWLLHHLMSEDTRLHRFLNQHRALTPG